MKRITLTTLLIFAIFAASNSKFALASDKKMAGSAGLGITYPMGDMGDVVKFPMIPLLLSFQYEVMDFLTIEGDVSYYIVSSAEDPISDYSQYQFGAGVRYWLTKDWEEGNSYEGIYLGAGLARTKIKIEMEYTGLTGYDPVTFQPTYGTTTMEGDEDFNTLVLKGGYMYPLKSITLDLGARYDAVDMSDFFDQGITIYCMALSLF